MISVRNKPKVFLSHSRKDEPFVKRLCDDLRHCQIEPWMDVDAIRHGQPWLDAIFKDGIPNCDCILIYLTKNSITSPMVKKEIDAGLLRQLDDSKVGFLPYVSHAEIRKDLRPDIRSLQTPELNPENYGNVFPCIVAEIWRCFSEQKAANSLSKEKLNGLEQVFPHAVDHDWLDDIKQASNVTIAKLKINFTDNPAYFQALREVLLRDGSVTLIVADPRSPAMWLRYAEEPSGVAPREDQTETVWKQGLEELAEILERFAAWRDRLIAEEITVTKLNIGVFPHYPTHAYYKFNDRLLVFHYPYRKRGFHSPLFLFADPTAEVYKFLDDSLTEVIKASISLESVIPDIRAKYHEGMFSDRAVLNHMVGIIPKGIEP